MKIVKLNAVLTAIFVFVSVLAVAIFNSPLRKLVAIVDLLLFAVGVAALTNLRAMPRVDKTPTRPLSERG